MDHAAGRILPTSASAAGEFIAHSATVTCLSFGPKTGRLLATASEDRKVNLWPVGKSNCIASLSGHTSSIESVKFGRNEDIVCAGSISGALKVWDLEAAQILRTFSGHKSGITCVDFHPYGDFFASGSLDSNIKLWDTRKKSCMYAYKAHSKDVRCLRFSPDGRWLASGGDEGIIKIWDLAAGKILAEFNEHLAPVTDLAFHPNELLMTSCSMDGTARFWDLEAFTQVSATGNEAGAMHQIAYNTDGTILFACCRDLLKCYQWEPTRTLSSIIVNWGKIKDLFVTPHQMIAASSTGMSVAVFAVSLSSSSKKSPVSALTSNALSSLNTSFTANLSFSTSNLSSSSLTSLLSPPTANTHLQQHLHKSSSNVAVVPTASQMMRLPPINSSHHLLNSNNSNSSSKVPPKAAVVFPEPHVSSSSSNGLSGGKKSAEVTPVTNSFTSFSSKTTATVKSVQQHQQQQQSDERLDLFPSTAKDLHLNSKSDRQADPSSGKLSWSPNHSTAGTKSLQVSSKVPPTKAAAIIFPEPQQPVKKKSSPPASLLFSNEDRVEVIPETRDHPAGLDIDEFLPKHLQDTVRQGYHPQPEISESEAMTSIVRGHKSLVTALSHRKKNVQIVLALWSSKDPVKALEQAIHFDDQSIIVDILNVINLKPSIWTLDVCQTLLPVIQELLQSKYECYMSVGCASLKLILKNFASMIKTNITAPPGIGVDISREERYNKCMSCYNHLLSVRAFILKRQTLQGKLGRSFREMSILMQNLE